MNKNNISLGKKISWETGKDASFRGFITNNKDLPKTQIYKKQRNKRQNLHKKAKKAKTKIERKSLKKWQNQNIR